MLTINVIDTRAQDLDGYLPAVCLSKGIYDGDWCQDTKVVAVSKFKAEGMRLKAVLALEPKSNSWDSIEMFSYHFQPTCSSVGCESESPSEVCYLDNTYLIFVSFWSRRDPSRQAIFLNASIRYSHVRNQHRTWYRCLFYLGSRPHELRFCG